MSRSQPHLIQLLAACAAAATPVCAWGLALQDELSLSPKATLLVDDGPRPARPENIPDVSLDAGQSEPATPPPGLGRDPTDLSGVDVGDLRNDVYTLAYRNAQGLGLGLASTGGLALTGGFATREGVQVNVYYVRRITEVDEAIRGVGIDLNGAPARAVGISFGWKF